MVGTSFQRMGAGVLLVLLVLATLPAGASLAQQTGTPVPTYSCSSATPEAATPAVAHGDMAGMGTPMAGQAQQVEFDQLYIDMMIPRHASIVALSEAALPRLEDERLQEIARTIIATQSGEIEELRGYREAFYGSVESPPMDGPMMDMMMQAMPGMTGTMEEMMVQMNPAAQVAAFCAAPDPDRAFIDITIAHHEMAIAASEAALEQAVHPEIADFAQRVIEDQQAEIAQLTQIREELYGA